MSKNQQKHRGLRLAFIGLVILIAAAFIYHQIMDSLPAHQSKNSAQATVVDSHLDSLNSLSSAQSPDITLVNDGVINHSAIDNDEVINPKDYEQFWLWTPPKDDSKLSQAHTLYLLQGEISSHNVPYYRFNTDTDDTENEGVTENRNESRVQATLATLIPQGLGVRSLSDKKIWLVYRATSQEWSDEVMVQVVERLEKWQRAGNQVMGIQIDYDAPTYRLDKYAQLLKSIRQQLPAQYQLSVTGLLDWSNQADDAQFIQLSDAIDELVIQTYQGTTTLPNYARYLKKLESLPFDFKVGIIEGGQWQGTAFLEDNPHFKGYVVFLR